MAEYKHGSMDTSEHEKVFHGLVKISAWVVVLVALTLVFLAIVAT